MSGVSERLARRIREDFGPASARAEAIVTSTSSSERTQAALVVVSGGRLERLESLARFAAHDERDVLAISPFAHADWRERLDDELDGRRPRVGPAVRRWRRSVGQRGCLLTGLVAAAVLLLLVLIPALVVTQHLEERARTQTAVGEVTDIDPDQWWEPRGRHGCTYTYVAGGSQHTGSSPCARTLTVGDRVQVSYDPGEPTSSEVAGSRSDIGLVVALAAWVVMLVVLARHWWRASN